MITISLHKTEDLFHNPTSSTQLNSAHCTENFIFHTLQGLRSRFTAERYISGNSLAANEMCLFSIQVTVIIYHFSGCDICIIGVDAHILTTKKKER